MLCGEMIFRLSACLEWVGTPRFNPSFLDELYDYLPRMGGLLQKFCYLGAPCEKSLRELSNLVMDVSEPSGQSGRFDVTFKESVFVRSLGANYTEPVTGTVRFVIDLETGELALETERSGREYQPRDYIASCAGLVT